jgi:predicted transcriptional regulator
MNPKLVSNICDVARLRLVSINVEMLLLDVAKTLSDTQISLVVVCDRFGAMVGIITKTNIVRWIGQCQGD